MENGRYSCEIWGSHSSEYIFARRMQQMKTSAEVKCVVGTAEFLHQLVYLQIFASADITLIFLLCDQPNSRSQMNPQT